MNTATQAGNFEIGKILRLPAFFVCKKRREKTLNIAKLTDWALRLDHPPWTASKGRGKQRFRRILTPLDISCRCCPYRYNECHMSRYKFFGRVYPKVMPKRCILEDLCEGDGEILRTRCERRLRTKGERLMQ